jgi:hypothetical protein
LSDLGQVRSRRKTMLLANEPGRLLAFLVDRTAVGGIGWPLRKHPGREADGRREVSRLRFRFMAPGLAPINPQPHPEREEIPMPLASTIAPATDLPDPNASAPQHMQALAYANRVRLARAALKRSVAAGEVTAASIVQERPWETESMTLIELLTSQRRWGRTRARKLLATLALNENKRLGTLTERQRALLTEELEIRAGLRSGEGVERLQTMEPVLAA